MSDKKKILTADQQDFVFRTKADLLAELIKFQIPDKPAAEQLAEMVNAAFEKLTV
ncbi:hypothetical protein [Enterobacter roggenkampii]|uniref:hypothetical protein n=1 Tax=Enterobacter roggenkampii TaxID=1812935 RepID=UPI003999B1E8